MNKIDHTTNHSIINRRNHPIQDTFASMLSSANSFFGETANKITVLYANFKDNKCHVHAQPPEVILHIISHIAVPEDLIHFSLVSTTFYKTTILSQSWQDLIIIPSFMRIQENETARKNALIAFNTEFQNEFHFPASCLSFQQMANMDFPKFPALSKAQKQLVKAIEQRPALEKIHELRIVQFERVVHKQSAISNKTTIK